MSLVSKQLRRNEQQAKEAKEAMSTEFVSKHPKGTEANDQERHVGMWAKQKMSIGYLGDQAKDICSRVRKCLIVSTWKHQSGTKTGVAGSNLLPDSGRQSLQRRFSGDNTCANAVEKLFAETTDPALTPSLQEWLIPEIQNQLKSLGMQSLELPATSPKVQSFSPRRLKVRSPKLHPYPGKDENQVESLNSAIKTSRIVHSAIYGSEDHFLDAKCKVVHSADEIPKASSSDLMRRDDRYRQSWEQKADSEFRTQPMLQERVRRPSRDAMDASAKGSVAANERVDVLQQFPGSAFGLNDNELLDSSQPSISLPFVLADVRCEEVLVAGSQDAVYAESELRAGEGADAPSVPSRSTQKRDAVLRKPRGWLRVIRGAAGYGKSITSKAMQESGPLDQEKLGQTSNTGNATVSESDGEVYNVKAGATDVDSGSSSLHRIPVEADSAGDGIGDIEQSRVRVRVHKKSCKELADLRIMQKIKAHDGAIWTMAFNHDGRFLATAGRDCVVRVWEVASPPAPAGLSPVQSRHTSPTKTSSEVSDGGRSGGRSHGTSNQNIRNEKQMYAPSAGRNDSVRAVASDLEMEAGPSQEEDSHGIRRTLTSFTSFYLKDQPHQCYRGHTEQIADVAWAHDSNFLLSASMDKTVQLWHASTGDCLRKLEHSDYVTRVAFNPLDVKIFVSTCLDQKVRLWNATNATMVAHADCKELLTAGAFKSDGLGVVVGSSQGILKTYSVEGHDLKLTDKVEVRSSGGKDAVGPRIIGLECNRDLILMTSNDSRLRVYSGTKLQCKYKGHKSTHTMTKAVFNPSGSHIACASEDSNVFVWSTTDNHDLHSRYSSRQKEKRQGHESFSVEQVTCTVFWPGYPTAEEIASRRAERPEEQPGSRHSKEMYGSLFGAVIVTGSHNGEIQVYQNFGQPVAVKGTT